MVGETAARAVHWAEACAIRARLCKGDGTAAALRPLGLGNAKRNCLHVTPRTAPSLPAACASCVLWLQFTLPLPRQARLCVVYSAVQASQTRTAMATSALLGVACIRYMTAGLGQHVPLDLPPSHSGTTDPTCANAKPRRVSSPIDWCRLAACISRWVCLRDSCRGIGPSPLRRQQCQAQRGPKVSGQPSWGHAYPAVFPVFRSCHRQS